MSRDNFNWNSVIMMCEVCNKRSFLSTQICYLQRSMLLGQPLHLETNNCLEIITIILFIADNIILHSHYVRSFSAYPCY